MDYFKSKRTLDDVLKAFGLSREEFSAIRENPEDQIEFPVKPTGIRVRRSPADRAGIFTTKKFEEGEVIGPVRIGGKRTPIGRYCAHDGVHPNSAMVMRPNHDGDLVDLIALSQIEPGVEVKSCYYHNCINTRPGK